MIHPLLDHDLLTLDPRTTEVAKGLFGSGNPLLNRVLEALGGRGLDFGIFTTTTPASGAGGQGVVGGTQLRQGREERVCARGTSSGA